MSSQKFTKLEEVDTLVSLAASCQEKLMDYSQEQIDRIVDQMAQAAVDSAEMLARMATAETGMGRVESKIAKNLFSAQEIYEDIRYQKTVGILKYDAQTNCYEVADPVGTIAAIIPTTNPTSTAIYKTLIAVKSRNTIILAPHPRSANCVYKTVEILNTAALAAGLPQGAISCLYHPTIEATQSLMRHSMVSLILATGGPGLVKEAYRSGKPAYGVGAGNPPAFIEKTADVEHAVQAIVTSQLFDYGTICSSEQSVVVESSLKDKVIATFKKHQAYFLNEEEVQKVSAIAVINKLMNPKIVGQPAYKIAEMAGISVPINTSVLLAPLNGTGEKYPLSYEKLAPLLAFYEVKSWQEGCRLSTDLLNLGGRGHTVGIHSNNPDIILGFSLKQPVSRIIVNAPTSQGGVGYATNLVPSMTLGCGSFGNNIISDNISAKHLLNIKRVTTLQKDFPLWDNNVPVDVSNTCLELFEPQTVSPNYISSHENKISVEKWALNIVGNNDFSSKKNNTDKRGWPYNAL